MRRPSNSSTKRAAEAATSDAKTVEAAAVRLLAAARAFRRGAAPQARTQGLSAGHRRAGHSEAGRQAAGHRRALRRQLRPSPRPRGQGRSASGPSCDSRALPTSQIEQALRSAEVDWVQLAGEVRRRKFGAAAASQPGRACKAGPLPSISRLRCRADPGRLSRRIGRGRTDAPDITPDIGFEAE